MTFPPEDQPAPDQEQNNDFEFPFALANSILLAVFCGYAFWESKREHSSWAHFTWVLVAGVTGLGAFVALVLTILVSDWYAKPLPRTDPDETSDELRPTLPE